MKIYNRGLKIPKPKFKYKNFKMLNNSLTPSIGESQFTNRSEVSILRNESVIEPRNKKPMLEKVIGVTSTSNYNFVFNPLTGELAYTAGSIIVCYHPDKDS